MEPAAGLPLPAHATPAAPGEWARALLGADEAAGLLRHPRSRHGGSHRETIVSGRAVVVFSSNDYLGLSVHPAVREAAAAAAMEHGVGATGSRHLSGCHDAIDDLEAALAAFEDSATATIAPSGYAANVAVLQALGGEGATILSDARNHASIVDGSRASRARVEVVAHRDLDDMERRLHAVRGRAVIVSDSVFSMDGSVADVAGLDALARRHGAWLVLDEAHALGVVGPGGRGAAAEAGLDPAAEHLVRVVTLSKALGAAGAAVCASATVRRLLLQRGRSLIFSTAPPHPAVAGAGAALRVLRDHPELPLQLRARGARLRRILAPLAPAGRPDMPVVPVTMGAPRAAVALEAALLEAGYLVQAVRPPTVPPGKSGVRVVATAVHTDGEVDGVGAAILEASRA